MNFRPRQSEDVGINLTPLIDVVFLMLIFFMVSTTFERHAELQIDLPRAETAQEEQRREIIELAIDAQGRYFVNGQELVNTRPETLRAALTQVSDGDTSLPLIIRADANTPHQSVVTAMDVAARLGIARLSIATTPDRDRD
ncbi:biopolymer transporter ExbD [Thioalkalivibrio denitrificans]|uniref:Biopolymer transporter ExbD n=1 Tax=Thioalkalivibrio denitrificans TaxID=108003 RepID=A0A1V3NI57_9GAMM|nr:biopolymer transporter ExbD [Thioalkalivibrio denitrificans]OOG24532.1 biopolymer transporter ExbD [Thioalkalivibrio denitrificans]